MFDFLIKIECWMNSVIDCNTDMTKQCSATMKLLHSCGRDQLTKKKYFEGIQGAYLKMRKSSEKKKSDGVW